MAYRNQAREGSSLRRWALLSRVVAALAGGYALAALATVFLSAALPLQRADAVLTATMLSFALYAAAIIWVFAAASAPRAWLGLVVCALPLGALCLWLY